MKKVLSTLLVICLLASLLCITAFAKEGDVSGVYDIQTAANVTVAAYTAADLNTPVEGESITVDSTLYTDFRAEAVRVSVTYTDAQSAPSGQFMIFVLEADTVTDDTIVPTSSNIVYINQTAASGSSVSFDNVYPGRLSNGKVYYIYLSNSTFGYHHVGSFRYYEPYLLGDVDLDGKIRSADAGCILQSLVHIRSLTPTQEKAADVNLDSQVRSQDASYILQYIVHIIDDFTEVQNKK